jgi:hypothetical protein
MDTERSERIIAGRSEGPAGVATRSARTGGIVLCRRSACGVRPAGYLQRAIMHSMISHGT